MAKRDAHDFFEQLGEVTRRLRSVAAQAYAEFELGTAQAKFLRHIGQNSGISQADLARGTATAPTLTGRALETLVERGWVRRKRSAEDRRQYVLELTAAGERARGKVEAAREQIIERIEVVLDQRDFDDIARISRKLLAAFDDDVPRGRDS